MKNVVSYRLLFMFSSSYIFITFLSFVFIHFVLFPIEFSNYISLFLFLLLDFFPFFWSFIFFLKILYRIASYHIILIISHFNYFSDARQCEYVHVRVRATRSEDRSIDSSRTVNCFWFERCVQQSVKRVNYNYWIAGPLQSAFLTSF